MYRMQTAMYAENQFARNTLEGAATAGKYHVPTAIVNVGNMTLLTVETQIVEEGRRLGNHPTLAAAGTDCP